MFSGPAHSVDAKPPSRASEATAPPCATSASSRSARYTLDLPLPLGPVTMFSGASGSTTSRSER